MFKYVISNKKEDTAHVDILNHLCLCISHSSKIRILLPTISREVQEYIFCLTVNNYRCNVIILSKTPKTYKKANRYKKYRWTH